MIKNFKFIIVQSSDSKHVFWLLRNLYPQAEILILSEKVIIKNYSKEFKSDLKFLHFLIPDSQVSKVFISVCLQDFEDTILEFSDFKFKNNKVSKGLLKTKTSLQNACFKIEKKFNIPINQIFYEEEFKNLWQH